MTEFDSAAIAIFGTSQGELSGIERTPPQTITLDNSREGGGVALVDGNMLLEYLVFANGIESALSVRRPGVAKVKIVEAGTTEVYHSPEPRRRRGERFDSKMVFNRLYPRDAYIARLYKLGIPVFGPTDSSISFTVSSSAAGLDIVEFGHGTNSYAKLENPWSSLNSSTPRSTQGSYRPR